MDELSMERGLLSQALWWGFGWKGWDCHQTKVVAVNPSVNLLSTPLQAIPNAQACHRWLQLTASSQRLLEMQSPIAGAFLGEDRLASTLRRSAVITCLFIFCKTNLCNESPLTSFSLKKLSLFSNVCIVPLNWKHWTNLWDGQSAITKRKNDAALGGHRNYKIRKIFRGSDDVICSKLERRWLNLSPADPRLIPPIHNRSIGPAPIAVNPELSLIPDR